MVWVYVFVGLGGLLALGRIYVNVVKHRAPRDDGWDARQIAQLRASGANPFELQDVDFFLAFPTAGAAQTVATVLSAEGFVVELRNVTDSVSHPVVLDARKSMQLNVPQMQALSARLRALAEAQGGRYDSWAASRAASRGDNTDPAISSASAGAPLRRRP